MSYGTHASNCQLYASKNWEITNFIVLVIWNNEISHTMLSHHFTMLDMIMIMEVEDLDEDEDGSFWSQLPLFVHQQRDCRIPRIALNESVLSPWEVLFNFGNNLSLITVTRFDHRSFAELENLFQPYFVNYSPYLDDWFYEENNWPRKTYWSATQVYFNQLFGFMLVLVSFYWSSLYPTRLVWLYWQSFVYLAKICMPDCIASFVDTLM